MADLFLKIVNMSISASWMVLAVLVLRFCFKKIPKWISCILWGIVGLRLMMPFSIESMFSLIPSEETISKVPGAPRPHFESGINMVDNPINEYINTTYFEGVSKPVGYFTDVTTVMGSIWLIGMLILLVYAVFSYVRLRNKVCTAVRLSENMYQSEAVVSPFVLGIINPRIYLPFHMEEQDMKHVIAHEQAHIKRKDHWWKPLGFGILTIHWFNPLVWLGYVLLCKDIELACDEKVVKELNGAQRADYSQALLTCSVKHHTITACPLAFGEVGVTDRVKSVLHYKKPAFWVGTVGIVISIIFAVCFLTNPMDASESIINKVLKLDREYEVNQIFDQKITLSIPASKLPEQVFSEEGLVFDKEDVIAYQDSTTTIYLKEARYANEGNDTMYFCFDFAFDLSKKEGKFFYPYIARENGLENAISIENGILRVGNDAYKNGVDTRGQGPGNQIWFYVSTEALRQAEGTISFDICLNRIRYSSVHVVETIQGEYITYDRMSDGTWEADGHTYKYRLELSGRTPNAIKDSTFVYLSNIEDITFEQAWKAAGLSSNTEDYFDVEEAVLVEWKVE